MHPEFSGDAVMEVQKALKINVVLAKAIVAEGLALVSPFTLVMWQLQFALVLVLVLRLSLVPDAGLDLGLRLLTNAGGKLTATNLTVVTPSLSLS